MSPGAPSPSVAAWSALWTNNHSTPLRVAAAKKNATIDFFIATKGLKMNLNGKLTS